MTNNQEFPPRNPGDFLREEFLQRKTKLSQEALAEALGVSRLTVNQIVNGHRAITADMALRLAHVLGTSPEWWLRMQEAVDLYQARQRLKEVLPSLPVLRERAETPPSRRAA